MADDPTTTGNGHTAQSKQPPQSEAEQWARLVKDTFVHGLRAWINKPQRGALREILQYEESGELVAGLRGELKDGLGFISYQYIPRGAVGLILVEIGRRVEELKLDHQGQPLRILDLGFNEEKTGEMKVETGQRAVFQLLSLLEARIPELIDKSISEACDIAIAELLGLLVPQFEKTWPGVRFDLSAADIIKQQAVEAAQEEARRRTEIYSRIPGMRTQGKKGRRPLWWAKDTLRREVIKALRDLPADKRDLEDVYALMSERHADRLPKSAQAFKQLLYEKGLRLKGLKEAAAKGRKRKVD
jgi:hypothetical protein